MGKPAVAVEAGSQRDGGEPQAGISRVPGSGIANPAEEKKTLAARGFGEASGEVFDACFEMTFFAGIVPQQGHALSKYERLNA